MPGGSAFVAVRSLSVLVDRCRDFLDHEGFVLRARVIKRP